MNCLKEAATPEREKRIQLWKGWGLWAKVVGPNWLLKWKVKKVFCIR